MIDYDILKLAANQVHPEFLDKPFDVNDIKTFDLDDKSLISGLNDFVERHPIEYHNYADNRIGTPPFLGKPLIDNNSDLENKVPKCVISLIEFVKKQGYEFDKVARMHINAQTPGMYAGPHYDLKDHTKRKTVVYMSSNSTGDLRFFDNIRELNEIFRVKYKLGRIVVFPSQICHEALPPESGFRTTLAFCFDTK